MDDRYEFQLRRKAIRLLLKDVKPSRVLQIVHRSRAWLSKWVARFERGGIAGLKSQSRRPRHLAKGYSPAIVRLVVQTRQRLLKQRVGLIGPRAIRGELQAILPKGPVPALTTLKRILRRHGLTKSPTDKTSAYFPRPLAVVTGPLQAMDWTCRYLPKGAKAYAFHTLNLRTRACAQTIAADKSTPTAITHVLETWKTLGLPRFLQVDNDAAFCGGYKVPRVFGQFVRLCLYLGIELIFLPVAEPERNTEVERLHGLWGQTVWERQHFISVGGVQRTTPKFLRWYMERYWPPALAGLTPAQAQRREARCRLTAGQIAHLPTTLPVTAGRLHFIRLVSAEGTIPVLNETWRVGKRWANKYVWATITTHRRRLEIWYQSSAQSDWRLVKTFVYPIEETVARLRPEFRHTA